MSLEESIVALTQAVRENTAVLQQALAADEPNPSTASRRKKAATPASGTSEPATTTASPAPTATTAPTPVTPPAPTSPPAAPAVTLKDWTDAFCKLGDTSRAGRDAALEILKSFSVERASLVKPEKYAEALAMAQAAQAKLDATPASAQSLV